MTRKPKRGRPRGSLNAKPASTVRVGFSLSGDPAARLKVHADSQQLSVGRAAKLLTIGGLKP